MRNFPAKEPLLGRCDNAVGWRFRPSFDKNAIECHSASKFRLARQRAGLRQLLLSSRSACGFQQVGVDAGYGCACRWQRRSHSSPPSNDGCRGLAKPPGASELLTRCVSPPAPRRSARPIGVEIALSSDPEPVLQGNRSVRRVTARHGLIDAGRTGQFLHLSAAADRRGAGGRNTSGQKLRGPGGFGEAPTAVVVRGDECYLRCHGKRIRTCRSTPNLLKSAG